MIGALSRPIAQAMLDGAESPVARWERESRAIAHHLGAQPRSRFFFESMAKKSSLSRDGHEP